MDGGYDDGYARCDCFWGREPGSLLLQLDSYIGKHNCLRVLDAGCGEGKNAIYLADKGASVTAIDISELAIANAKDAWHGADNVQFQVGNVEDCEFPPESFDMVVAYGLFHCVPSEVRIRKLASKVQAATVSGGLHVVCAFNDRMHDLSAHPGFRPTLLPHAWYLQLYHGWDIALASDLDLYESHPHNNIPHVHSLTRIIAVKR